MPGRLTLVDLIVALLAVAAAARGWRRGFLGQTFELGGGFLGLVAGVLLGPRLASLVTNSAGLEAALLALIVVLVGLSFGQAIGFALGYRFGSFARRARLGGADSLLGAGLGVVMTLVAYWLLGSLLSQGPFSTLARQLERSVVLRALNGVTQPPDVLAYIQQYLDTSGFPQVFVGPPSHSSAPVRLPPPGRSRRAYLAARDSTVRIVVPGCGGTQLGSGWISSPHTVVTNAHVVAGGTSVTINEPSGSHDGSVVLFDPNTDLAVVRTTDELGGPALRLRRGLVDVGTQGVTIGYPGTDVRQRPRPAAVRAHLIANGLDIYGGSQAQRDVYELRARVREGDSGGPFVLPGGRVAAVVFAASSTERHTGYALTTREIRDEVARGRRATRAVGTGRCTH
jgi:S1-C subfamily serine protease